MKRSIILALLCTLVVATLFAAASCKSQIGGGLGIPHEDGEYLDLGSGWQSTDELPSEDAQVSLVGVIGFNYSREEFTRKPKIPFKGSRIKYALRNTSSPDEMRVIGAGIVQVRDAIILCPVIVKQKAYDNQFRFVECPGGCYVPGDITKVTVNRSDTEAGYLYFEITDIPTSPTGFYCLVFGREMRFLSVR